MTLENEKFLLKLDLQAHADGDDDNTDLSGDDMLAAAIREINKSYSQEGELDDENDDADDSDDIDDSDDNLDDEDIDDEDEELDDEDDSDEDDSDDEEDEEPVKKKQSKQDNAKFAEKRRQAQRQAELDAEIERMKQESPEFKLAQMLSEQFGKPVEDVMADLEEQMIQQQAKQEKRPVEDIRRERQTQNELQELRNQVAMMQFQNWEVKTKADGQRLMNEYKGILTQEDIDTATDYILNVAKNVELPLEDAVFAVHGRKLVQGMAKNKVQDDLASASGRKKKTPLPPNSGKQTKVITLSADEQAIARAFNMTDEEYQKYKS